MKAAIYARKSNDDDRSEENKSITRQRDRAIAFAESKGWTVDPEHVFEDDGVSGAEFERRRGLLRMMAQLAKKPRPFDVIVMSEISRLGRDMVRNAVVIDDIRNAGVRIFYYLTNDEEHADTPEQRVMVTLKSFAAEVERARAAERTRDALLRKAEKGLSAGGRVYGYDNIWVLADGTRMIAPPGARMKDDSRSHTDWQINPAQADVVRGLFRMYVDGYGHTVIAKTLNGEERYQSLRDTYFAGQTPAPPQHGGQGTGSWAPSTIRVMLYRIRYVGKVQYGEYRNVRNGGRVGKCVKQDTFTIVEREDLRIVPEDLWAKVQQRLTHVRDTYIRENNGTVWGRPEAGRESKYLLSGLARCGCRNGEHVCGRSIAIVGGQKRSHYYYGCSYNQNRGNQACANDTRERMAAMDAMVLEGIEARFLTPAAVDFVVDEAMRLYAAMLKRKPDALPQLEAELRREQRELANIMRLIADGNAPKTILAEIADRERRIEALTREIAGYTTPAAVGELDLRRSKKEAREMAGRFKDIMMGDTARARQALRKLLRDRDGNFSPLWFDPVSRDGRKTYTVRGLINPVGLVNKTGTEDSLGQLLNGIALPFELEAA